MDDGGASGPPRPRRAVPDRRRRACASSRSTARRSGCAWCTSASGSPTISTSPTPADWWLLGLRFPPGSRFEYKIEVTDSFGTHLIEDPLNPTVARHPFGGNSVCEAEGYHEPGWATSRPDVPAGTLVERGFDSAALGRYAAGVGVPARRIRRRRRPPISGAGPPRRRRLLPLRAARHRARQPDRRRALPPVIVAGLHPVERLVEYADDARHHEFVTSRTGGVARRRVPAVRRALPAGASFGAVASLSAAAAAPAPLRRRAPAIGVVRRGRHRVLAAP